MGTNARSARHRRQPDPSSGLDTRIGYQHRHVSGIVATRTIVDGVHALPHTVEPRGSERVSRANTTIRCAAEYSGWHAERINRSYDTR